GQVRELPADLLAGRLVGGEEVAAAEPVVPHPRRVRCAHIEPGRGRSPRLGRRPLRLPGTRAARTARTARTARAARTARTCRAGGPRTAPAAPPRAYRRTAPPPSPPPPDPA